MLSFLAYFTVKFYTLDDSVMFLLTKVEDTSACYGAYSPHHGSRTGNSSKDAVPHSRSTSALVGMRHQHGQGDGQSGKTGVLNGVRLENVSLLPDPLVPTEVAAAAGLSISADEEDWGGVEVAPLVLQQGAAPGAQLRGSIEVVTAPPAPSASVEVAGNVMSMPQMPAKHKRATSNTVT